MPYRPEEPPPGWGCFLLALMLACSLVAIVVLAVVN